MTELIFKEIGGWATLELTNDISSYTFQASYVRSSGFNELLDALTVVAASNNTTATAIFDLETEGKLRMIFTHLPYYQVAGHWNTYLRLEVYAGIDWDAHDDVLTDLPVPQPVFQSIIPNKYYFINSIIKEFERVGKDAFSSWDNETWDERIQQLKEAVQQLPK